MKVLKLTELNEVKQSGIQEYGRGNGRESYGLEQAKAELTWDRISVPC